MVPLSPSHHTHPASLQTPYALMQKRMTRARHAAARAEQDATAMAVRRRVSSRVAAKEEADAQAAKRKAEYKWREAGKIRRRTLARERRRMKALRELEPQQVAWAKYMGLEEEIAAYEERVAAEIQAAKDAEAAERRRIKRAVSGLPYPQPAGESLWHSLSLGFGTGS